MSFDDYLFRYRVPSGNTIEAFNEDRLYFSTPENFNDPYDSLFYIDKESFGKFQFNFCKANLKEIRDEYNKRS